MWYATLAVFCLVGRTWLPVVAQVTVDGDTVLIDPRLVRKLAFGDCAFSSSVYDGLALHACFAEGTVLYLGSTELSVGPDNSAIVRDTATQAVLWRCLPGGQCVIGSQIPLGIEALAPGSITVTGQAVTRTIGAWVVSSETLWRTTVVQAVCLTGGSGVCGTRIGRVDNDTATAVILLTTGQVVIDNGVSAAFVQSSLARYTVITQEIVRAAEDTTTALPVVVARAPVTGETGVLTCTVYTAPSGCGRFRWRQARAAVIPTVTALDVTSYPELTAALNPNDLTVSYLKFTTACNAIGATNAEELPYKLCADSGCTDIKLSDTLALDQCFSIATGAVRCFCADAT